MIRTTNNVFKVLEVLFSNKFFTYHNISKKTKLSVMGVSKIINKLREANIVDVESIGKSKIPKLVLKKDNIEVFALTEKFKFNEFLEKHGKLKGFLLTLKDGLDTDFSLIFGSYASDEKSAASDLDVLIISSKDNIKNFNRAKSLVDIEVNPIFIKKEDFIKEFKKGHRLYGEIINGKRVLINGEYKFWEMLILL